MDDALRAFYVEHGCGPGSRLYYASRYLPGDRRDAWRGLHAVARDLDPWLGPRRDPQVRATRMQWWAEEAQRLAQGEPRHPVTRALVPVPDAGAELSSLLGAAGRPGRPADWEAFTAQAGAYSDPLWRLCAHLAGAAAPPGLLALGRALRCADLVRHRPRLAAAGRDPLPRGTGTDASSLRRAARQARRTLDQAMAALAARPVPAGGPAWLLGAIARRELAEVADDRYDPLSGIIHLTPILKLLITWRAQRRYRRLARRA